jgi:hypothetical protein
VLSRVAMTSDRGSAPPRRRPWISRRRAAVVLALVTVAGSAGLVAAVAGGPAGQPAVTVRSPDGKLIAGIPLHGDRFALRYRNSIYHTLAEERYRVRPDGRFELIELATDQLALLEEYYQLPGASQHAPAGDRRNYVADPDPAHPAVFETLRIAATDLGERTLLVPGEPSLPIWERVGGDDPTVILDVEENS